MKDINNDSQEALAENDKDRGLWLTNHLLEQLRNSAWIGAPLMVFSVIVGTSLALLSLFTLLFYWVNRQSEDFYLLEGGNLFRVIKLLSTVLVIYCFAQGVIHGYKAWRLLKFSQTDDDALLEGSERLGKMFRWLTLWGGAYIAKLVLKLLWSGSM